MQVISISIEFRNFNYSKKIIEKSMYRAVRSGVVYTLMSMLSIAPKMLHADSKTSVSDIKVVTDAREENTGENIVVLQEADPVPATAVKRQTIKLSGSEIPVDPTYGKLLASAKEMAKKSDANIVKIDRLGVRNKANICDEMVATFYKAEKPRLYETEFSWDPSRRLTWEDFRGPVQSYSTENIAAATYCAIGFETNNVVAGGKVKINVFNSFYPTKSWARDEEKDMHVLAHEQCHFDICELYTRKLRERMAAAHVDISSLSKLKVIYRELQKEYEGRQELYEDQTNHGLIYAEQDRWQKDIAHELQAEEAWKES